jgi:hypothetical protein
MSDRMLDMQNGPSVSVRRWTIRGQGLQLWPKVVDGPGFDDEEEIVVVPLGIRGSVPASAGRIRQLEAALRAITEVRDLDAQTERNRMLDLAEAALEGADDA